uniref:Uncharacterized protein n=1 Tax=Strongyloides stercoralis TaxID=6248 RepID=A0A0K0E3Z1_STRER
MATPGIVHDIYVDHFYGIVNAGNYKLASGSSIDGTEEDMPFQYRRFSTLNTSGFKIVSNCQVQVFTIIEEAVNYVISKKLINCQAILYLN